jgi:hypothetical protein
MFISALLQSSNGGQSSAPLTPWATNEAKTMQVDWPHSPQRIEIVGCTPAEIFLSGTLLTAWNTFLRERKKAKQSVFICQSDLNLLFSVRIPLC